MKRKTAVELLYWLLAFPVATVLLLELVLQAASYANQHFSAQDEPASWLTDNLRIVAIGDSNTYGLYLQPLESYPKQLESLWNSSHEKKLEVINLGYPGSNSSRVVANLPEVIQRLQPDIILVMIGTNDEWTAPITAADAVKHQQHWWSALQSHSRVYRLYCLVTTPPAEQVKAEQFDVGMTMRGQEHQHYDAKAGLRENLAFLMQQAPRYDTRIILLSYAADRSYYRLANSILRETVQQQGYKDFIDVTPAFAGLMPPKGEANEYFFNDLHATAKGNALVAQTVLLGLETLLDVRAENTQ